MINLLFQSPKRVYSVMVLASIGMMSVALFMEKFLLLEPCMLCYLQRFFVILFGLIGLAGILHNSKSIGVFKGYLFAAIISSSLGALLSIRQLYLQSLPAELVPSCAPDIEYLLDSLPFLEVIIMAIQGDGNCAEVLWSFLGISIPGWLLIGFVCFLIFLLGSLYYVNKIHSQKTNR